MKFYYNGKLMRTSKNHVYTHAVVANGNCLSCSSTFEGAKKVIYSEISHYERVIQTELNKKDALEKGLAGYWDVSEKKKYWMKIEKDNERYTVEWADNAIKCFQDRIEEINLTWQVVELEAR